MSPERLAETHPTIERARCYTEPFSFFSGLFSFWNPKSSVYNVWGTASLSIAKPVYEPLGKQGHRTVLGTYVGTYLHCIFMVHPKNA